MNKVIEIIDRREVFARAIFHVEEATFRFERFDGSLSEAITRLVLKRGESVAILIHDLSRRLVLLTEQFRYPTPERGPGWLLELPAGMVDPGETEEESARRETLEETGYELHQLTRIASVYPSPGGSSERIHIFYAATSLVDRVGRGGGIVAEGEDIRLVELSVDDAISKVRTGEIADAKTVIAIQWLELTSISPGY